MVGLGAVPAVLQFLLMIFLPETPRWLMKAGRKRKARVVLERVYAAELGPVAEEILRGIEIEMAEEEEATQSMHYSVPGDHAWPWLTQLNHGLVELFGIGGNRRALTIACLLQGLQQLCGFVRFFPFSWQLFADHV